VIILPRQARDRHRESSQKEYRFQVQKAEADMLQGEFDIDERPKTVQPQLAAAQYVELPSAQANVRSAQGVVQAAVTHEKTLRNFYRAKVINAVYLRRF